MEIEHIITQHHINSTLGQFLTTSFPNKNFVVSTAVQENPHFQIKMPVLNNETDQDREDFRKVLEVLDFPQGTWFSQKGSWLFVNTPHHLDLPKKGTLEEFLSFKIQQEKRKFEKATNSMLRLKQKAE